MTVPKSNRQNSYISNQPNRKQQMSLKTWKEEFYKVEASQVPQEEALQHSLTKWIGLRRENLAKHEVERNGFLLGDTDIILAIDGTSCALCLLYVDESCHSCPLRKAKEDQGYFYTGDHCWKEYSIQIRTGNPEPMIRLIQKAIRITEASKNQEGVQPTQ